MFDKNAFRKEMEERITKEQEAQTKKYKTIYKDNVPTWREKGDEKGLGNIVDVIPYKTGSRDPNTEEGKWAYRLPVRIHKNVGVNDDTYICLNAMYRKPCPICEYRKKLKDKGVDWEEYKKYFPKKRSLFNVWVQSEEKEKEKGVQIWDISDFLGWDKIYPLTQKVRGGGNIYFMEPDREEGRSIAFRRKDISKNKAEYFGHQLLERQYDIPKDILDSVFTLDELIYEPTYEEVAEAFYSTLDEDIHNSEIKKENSSEQDARFSRVSKPEHSSSENKNSEFLYRTENTQSESKEELCPYGFIYGSDFDLMEECKDCKEFRGCEKAYNHKLEQRKNKGGSRR